MPGLDGLLTCLQSKYATITALQNAINNFNNTVNNEISNVQTEIDNIEITNQQNVSKYLHHHTNHTDFMYQRNITKNDNRRSFLLYSKAFSHFKEKVFKSYKFKH